MTGKDAPPVSEAAKCSMRRMVMLGLAFVLLLVFQVWEYRRIDSPVVYILGITAMSTLAWHRRRDIWRFYILVRDIAEVRMRELPDSDREQHPESPV